MSEDAKPASRGFLTLLITAILGFVVDLITKSISFEHLVPPEPAYEFIPGFIHFTAVQNRGAVFGMGQGMRWLFILISLAAIVFVAYLFVRSRRQWWMNLTLGMLLAGIIGNLYDRVIFGYVRDMIHAFPRWPNLFPWVFNVADSLLCVSIGILLVTGMFAPDERITDKS